MQSLMTDYPGEAEGRLTKLKLNLLAESMQLADFYHRYNDFTGARIG